MGQTKETMSIKQRTKVGKERSEHPCMARCEQPALLFIRNTYIGSIRNWMLRKVTFSGMVPFFQVYLHIAIDNIHGNKKRYLENSVNRLHKKFTFDFVQD